MYDVLGLRNDETATIMLRMAGLEVGEIPRFRDCYPAKSGQAIIVYTRTGGNNREEYADEIEHLCNKDNFIDDYDDTFDNTYMSFEFTPLPEYKDLLMEIVKESPQSATTGAEKFQKVIEMMEQKSKEKNSGTEKEV